MRAIAAVGLAALGALASAQTYANISNVIPRVSTDGAIMDAHDSKITRVRPAGWGF
jgi:hypothetical protein